MPGREPFKCLCAHESIDVYDFDAKRIVNTQRMHFESVYTFSCAPFLSHSRPPSSRYHYDLNAPPERFQCHYPLFFHLSFCSSARAEITARSGMETKRWKNVRARAAAVRRREHEETFIEAQKVK